MCPHQDSHLSMSCVTGGCGMVEGSSNPHVTTRLECWGFMTLLAEGPGWALATSETASWSPMCPEISHTAASGDQGCCWRDMPWSSKSQQTTPVFPPPFSSQLLSPAWRGSLIKEEGGGNKKKNDECNNICISCVSRLLSGILPTSQKEKPGGSLNPGGHLATVRLLCFVDTQLPVITAGLEFCIFLLLGCAWQ